MTSHLSPSSECWLKLNAVMENGDAVPPCDGHLVKAHLIPKQLLKREHATWAIRDPRSFVWACGGPIGNTGCHGMLDVSRRLRVPFERLPAGLIGLAEELGLGWWLIREYGVPTLEGEADAV